jgi:hypothetical protein
MSQETKNKKGIMVSEGDFTARIVQVGTVQGDTTGPYWDVTIHDKEIGGLRKLHTDETSHQEPTEKAAKNWAEKHLTHLLQQENIPISNFFEWHDFY